MFRRQKKTDEPVIPVPAKLPPLEGLDDQANGDTGQAPHTWLWTLIAALIVVATIAFVLFLAGRGIYDGLRDRALENQRIAQEHYALGLEYLEAKDYELAIAEFDLAVRHDSNLSDAHTKLHEAKELARAQIKPTSETRQDAAKLLYQEAVAYYESGNLPHSAEILDELRGLDADYQRENVETMLTTAHYQLGLNAVAENRLDEGTDHFMIVLDIAPDDESAQDQLNLVNLYTAALNHWERDWSATIQALKGLYALAPDYKDVKDRLRDAYVFHAESLAEVDEWCRAADQYAAAVEILPIETLVDRRDDAQFRCQATAEAPLHTPTAPATEPPKATPRPTAQATAEAQASAEVEATAQPTAPAAAIGQGRIAFASYDAARQVHDVYVIDLAQGDALLLQANAHQPVFAPGGRRMVFRNLDPLHLGLAILDLSNDTIGELTAHAEDSTPIWSPDAGQIVFASDKHGDRKWRLYVISPGEVRGEGAEWAFGQTPAWSRDGSRIAYHGCDERGDNCAVWVMQPGGFSPARLTTDASDTAPAWSPDGTQVAFVSARSGNWEIFVVEMATGEERRLTDHPASDAAPTWSPDGKQLTFLSNRDGVWAVYILDLRSGEVQKVIATGDAYPDPLNEQLFWLP